MFTRKQHRNHPVRSALALMAALVLVIAAATAATATEGDANPVSPEVSASPQVSDETTPVEEEAAAPAEKSNEAPSAPVETTVAPKATTSKKAPATKEAPKKVFVCKYVGKPGDDERLKSGKNPISVSVNAIPDYQGVGSYFADAQGRSFVVAENTGQPAPGVDQCPPADTGPEVPPKPDKVVTTTNEDGTPNCETKTVEVVTTTTTTDWVLKDNVWVEGEPVVTTATSTRQATTEECDEVVVPPKPKKIVKRSTTEGEPNCELNEVEVTKTKTVTDWVLNKKGTKWVKGEPVVTTKTSTRPTTAEECGNGGEIVKPDFGVPTKCGIIDPTNSEELLPAYFFYFLTEDDEGTGPIIIGPGEHKEIAVTAEQVSYYVYYDSPNKEDKGTVTVEQDCGDGGTEPPPPTDVPDEPKVNEPPKVDEPKVVTPVTTKQLPSGAPHTGASASSNTAANGLGAIAALMIAGAFGVAARRRTNA